MSYSECLAQQSAAALNWQGYSAAEVERVLEKAVITATDLPVLVSPAASSYISQMAERSHWLTRQRFGANVQLFMPLYLSNLCTNICTYCGFSADAKVKRTWLRPQQLVEEIRCLNRKGVEHILLVSGEAEHKVGLDYFCESLSMLRPHFAQLQLEAQPFDTSAYCRLADSNLDGVVVYQETYNRQNYAKVHLSGLKTDFNWRLDTPDRVAAAGIEKIGLGILLGLSDWREDAVALGRHLQYLQRKYWRQRYSLGFPRLRPFGTDYAIPNPVGDRDFVQLLVAMRLCFGDVEMVLSTRESRQLRDALLPLGITHMSAESSTQPGGYSGATPAALKQFDTDDMRSIEQIKDVIRGMSYQPLFADQIPVRQLP